MNFEKLMLVYTLTNLEITVGHRLYNDQILSNIIFSQMDENHTQNTLIHRSMFKANDRYFEAFA